LNFCCSLTPTVNRFFDKVLVMADDPRLRANRLRLLKKLDDLFLEVADFSKIQVGDSLSPQSERS